MTTTDEADKLMQQSALYDECEGLLWKLPEDAQDLLENGAIVQNPEIREMVEAMKAVGERYRSVAITLNDRLEAATWEHIQARFGLAPGDHVEVSSCLGESFRIQIESAKPWRFESGEFQISGPQLLASGKPGKRVGTLFIHQQKWIKISSSK